MQEGVGFVAGVVGGGVCFTIWALIMARVEEKREAKAEEKSELDRRLWVMSSDIATLIDRVNRLEGR